MNYKHIVFDFGNVLATFQSDDLLRSYCNSEDLPILKDAIYHNWQALDEGSISYEKYQEETLHLLPDCLHDTARKCFATWYQHMIPIQPVWDMIHRLKEQQTGLYILSNAPIFFEEHADFSRLPAYLTVPSIPDPSKNSNQIRIFTSICLIPFHWIRPTAFLWMTNPKTSKLLRSSG